MNMPFTLQKQPRPKWLWLLLAFVLLMVWARMARAEHINDNSAVRAIIGEASNQEKI